MNKRSSEILILLTTKNNLRMSESWQRRFQVSERTIRNDINSINDYLELQNLSSIQFGSNGLLLVEDDIEEVMTLEADNDLYSYRYQRKSERD